MTRTIKLRRLSARAARSRERCATVEPIAGSTRLDLTGRTIRRTCTLYWQNIDADRGKRNTHREGQSFFLRATRRKARETRLRAWSRVIKSNWIVISVCCISSRFLHDRATSASLLSFSFVYCTRLRSHRYFLPARRLESFLFSPTVPWFFNYAMTWRVIKLITRRALRSTRYNINSAHV